MKLAVDAMGGDFAPVEIIRGAVAGAREHGVGVILVGPRETIEAELAGLDTGGLDIEIEHTDEYLVEGEHPAFAMRKKRRASILVAVKLVRDGRAAAAVGAGPTGGVFAAALQVLGTLEGISRPVIGGPFLGFAPETIMIDLGGNVDSRPDQLLDFGILGTVYARKWMNIPDPTVALVSNGVEEGKGNEVVKETYELYKKSGLNFIGNVEGNDIAHGKANVVICDGFVGNVVAKFCEGLGDVTARWLDTKLREKLSPDETGEILADLKRATIPADAVGGGPLWGVNGVVCKAHGRSKAAEIAGTIGTAKRTVAIDLVGTFATELAAVRRSLNITYPNADVEE
jgi:glycerol-3-phosphate acyltransferase PlsX